MLRCLPLISLYTAIFSLCTTLLHLWVIQPLHTYNFPPHFFFLAQGCCSKTTICFCLSFSFLLDSRILISSPTQWHQAICNQHNDFLNRIHYVSPLSSCHCQTSHRRWPTIIFQLELWSANDSWCRCILVCVAPFCTYPLSTESRPRKITASFFSATHQQTLPKSKQGCKDGHTLPSAISASSLRRGSLKSFATVTTGSRVPCPSQTRSRARYPSLTVTNISTHLSDMIYIQLVLGICSDRSKSIVITNKNSLFAIGCFILGWQWQIYPRIHTVRGPLLYEDFKHQYGCQGIMASKHHILIYHDSWPKSNCPSSCTLLQMCARSWSSQPMKVLYLLLCMQAM